MTLAPGVRALTVRSLALLAGALLSLSTIYPQNAPIALATVAVMAALALLLPVKDDTPT